MRPLLLLFSVLFIAAIGDDNRMETRVKKLIREKKLIPFDTARFSTKESEVTLGRTLFSDTRFSRQQNISCASCHIEEKGFSNGSEFSQGTHGSHTQRHVPHLYNLAWQNSFFWDGRVTSLEDQLKQVIASKTELDLSLDEVIARLSSDTSLQRQFEAVYPQHGINRKTVVASLLAFERSITSGISPYDRYLGGDTAALTTTQVKGFQLFITKANCISCHFGQNLSDGLFHNVGVITEDKGRHLIDKIGMANEFESRPYPFFSNFKAFKTPTLRNLSRTAPYFHNGSKRTLREVLDFYNKGGDNSDRTGVAKEIKPLQLTVQELDALESFLESLNGSGKY